LIEQRQDARLELLGQELLVRSDVQDRARPLPTSGLVLGLPPGLWPKGRRRRGKQGKVFGKMTKLTPADLAHFTGTGEWYRHGLNRRMLYTDGVQYLAEKASLLAARQDRLPSTRTENSGRGISGLAAQRHG